MSASLALLVLFLGLFLASVPLSLSLLMASTGALVFFAGNGSMVAGKLFSSLASFPLMAVPFFILAAEIIRNGNVSHRIIDMANAVVGRLPGGLALTALLSCAGFAAVSGSSVATVAAIGAVLIPEMTARGYNKTFAVGSIVAGGTLGILIPPSIPFIIYGFATGTSVPRLFLAGVVPGVLLTAALMSVTLVGAMRLGYVGTAPATFAQRRTQVTRGLWTLLIPLVIFGGIYGTPRIDLGPVHLPGGAIFTPTEAAIVAVFVSIVVASLIYRELPGGKLMGTLASAARRIGSILLIVAGASMFGFVLNNAYIPQTVGSWLLGLHLPVWLFLLAVNLLLFLAGDFMDAVPIILIIVPIIFPVARDFGIDPVHFGVMTVVNMEMGAITPPIGMNLFMASQVTGMDLYEVLRASLPWILVVVVVLLVVTYVPWLSTWLPNLVFGVSH